MNIQDCFPLGWTGWISLLSKGLSRVISSTIIQKQQFFGAQHSLWSNSHIHTRLLEKTIALTIWTVVNKMMSLLFNMLSSFVIGEGNGTPLQYSCLENPMDGGAWWAAVHGVAKSRTQLSDFTLTFLHWRRKWQPTPVFLPGESQGWGSLVGCRLWGRTESDTTEGLSSNLVLVFTL